MSRDKDPVYEALVAKSPVTAPLSVNHLEKAQRHRAQSESGDRAPVYEAPVAEPSERAPVYLVPVAESSDRAPVSMGYL